MKQCVLALMAGWLLTNVARADVGPTCDAAHTIDKYQMLRRLSLDLRDRIPSIEEYEALDGVEEIPASVVSDYLHSDDFRRAMRRYHEHMFWPNVSNVRLHNQNGAIVNHSPAWWNPTAGRQRTWRGALGASCGDYEQTHFLTNSDGSTDHVPDPDYVQVVGGVRDEGWRYVNPYWAPTTQIKVCAYDAQETMTVMARGAPLSCGDYRANGNAACGCGPNLRFCYGGTADATITASMREQIGRSVDDVTVGGHPYTDILLSTKAYENGPLAFWKANLASNLNLANTYVQPDPQEEIPDLDWTDSSWRQVERGGPHAGVVTLPAYLLRFQTDRGRANRMRIDFACEFFVPPAVLSPAPSCDPAAADLTQRCNCQYCHSKLEPLASFFGQFSEAGTTVTSDTSIFPEAMPSCVSTNPSQFCVRYYVTHADAHNPGKLLTLQWVDAHPEYLANIFGVAGASGGPRKWAREIIDDGTFAQCTVKKVFAYLIKREVHAAGDQTDELELLGNLSQGFKDSNYSFPWLVEQIVSLPQYRRIH